MTVNAGGAAAAGGMDYQARCAALASSAILAGTAAPTWGSWSGPIVRIDCETSEPVDDIRLQSHVGSDVVLQCKRTIQLNAGVDSEFAKTVDQFVRQHMTAGHETDSLVLATSSLASGTVKNVLRMLLDRLRELPERDEIASVANNGSDATNLDRFLKHVLRSWTDHAGIAPSQAELRTFLKQVHVLVLDVGPGEPGEQLAIANLGHVVADPTDAPSAWAVLCTHAAGMATNRSGANLSVLQRHLAGTGIGLVGAVDFQGDVTKLKDASHRALERLTGALVTIPGPDGNIDIARTIHQQVEAAAATGPALLTGEPGAGKTVAVYHLARSLQAAGHEVAFLPVGSLQASSLGELNQELGLDHHVFDVLAQWAPGARKTLIIDSLDAARSRGQPDLWRHLIDHVTADLPDWRLVVTIRRWDLQHSKHLSKQFPAPVEVSNLNDQELSAASTGWPELTQVIANAPADFRTLIRNPFNLRLAADLLMSGVPLGTLHGLDTQIAMLDGYWEHRVAADPGGSARHSVASAVARRALEAHTMTVDTGPILEGDTAASHALSELLSVNALRDATTVTLPGTPAVVAFAHHVLHDYAVSLQLHGTQGLIGELKRDPNLGIAVAPSIDLYLQRLWDQDPPQFWTSVVDLYDAGVGALPVVQAADIAARNLSDVEQLGALTTPVSDGTATDTHLRLLRDLSVAYILDRRENSTTPDPSPFADLALLLSRSLDTTEWIVRILVSELACIQPPLAGANLGKVGEAARSALTHLWAGDPTVVNRIAIQSVMRTAASDPAATEDLLRRALESDRLVSHGASDLWQLTNGVPELLPHCPRLVRDIYTVVMAYDEQSREETRMLGGQLLSLTSNRRQDIESAKYNLVQHYDHVLAAAPDLALQILRSAVPTKPEGQ